MKLQTDHHSSVGDSDLSDQPRQIWFYKWGLGVALPLALIADGIYLMVKRQAEFGAEVSITFHGWNAIIYGAVLASAGLMAHLHYFWGSFYDDNGFAVLGKIVTLISIVSGLIMLIVRVALLGIV